MDTAKIKNFIIIILVFTNAFLLFTILADEVRENEMDRFERNELTTLFESKDIKLAQSIDVKEESQSGAELVRDMEAELAMVEAVLGESKVEDQGGNIYFYNGENGQAKFRGTGEFELIFYNRSVEYGKSRSETAFEVLEEMGINTGLVVSEIQEDDSYKIKINFSYNEKDVYNSSVTFSFTGDRIILVSGVRVFDTKITDSNSDTIDALTALVSFLGGLSKNGYVVTEVYGIELEYGMSVSVSETCVLSPTWRIETDTGNYRINAVTSNFETIS